MDSVKSDTNATPSTTYLKNYTVAKFLIDSIALQFDLHESKTIVRSTLQVRRNPESLDSATSLELDGQNLQLIEIAINGKLLQTERYTSDDESLTIVDVADAFELSVTTQINPAQNSALEGLYLSSGMLCTQCEAQGFRRITYFPDRPDVMSLFSVTLTADKNKFPILLSNGNLIEQGESDNGRHWVKWVDPFPKSCYLFALVAGDLYQQQDTFTTCSGKNIDLYLFVEHENKHKCEHALKSLQQAMKWDEDTFGREYDLQRFMIVAVNDFNMGAMENKGLNIFNSSCVLASPDSTTDMDYYRIQSIIGHEYFHNWSGNRVTCRDWFQLSLKEGFTVFRDQQFSADLNSSAVQRINDVDILRNTQFSQDAGPMAHPVRPDDYIEISNFYTVTVYNKGAEVVRMIHTLVGDDGFRRGTDVYFERHDGQAVTVEDFIAAMQAANNIDLKQFMRWYQQAGTPKIEFIEHYEQNSQQYSVTLKQSCAATPAQDVKHDFHIPIRLGLLDSRGQAMPLDLLGEDHCKGNTSCTLELNKAQQSFTFTNIKEKPVLSLLRGFSAPIKITTQRSREELAFLFAFDSDAFNRWDAGQQLALNIILCLIADFQNGITLKLDDAFIVAFRKTLLDKHLDAALITQALSLPSESYIADQCEIADVDAIYHVRLFIRQQLAHHLQDDFLNCYHACQLTNEYRFNVFDMGQRSLRNICLSYLMELGDTSLQQLCVDQFNAHHNMTDVLAALMLLANHDTQHRKTALQYFYEKWQHDTQVIDKWFSIQACSRLPNNLQNVKKLMQHSAFTMKNPNKVRALIGSFCMANQLQFHNQDGSGYRFLADQVLSLDASNPQIAARLIQAFSRWKRFNPSRQEKMQQQLQRIVAHENLSKDVFEIASKTLIL